MAYFNDTSAITNVSTTMVTPTMGSTNTDDENHIDPTLARVNATISLLLVIVVLIGNFCIVLIFVRFKKVRDLNNTAVTMLSICDLMRGSIVMLPKIYNQYTLATRLVEPICTATALTSSFSFVFNPQLLALIAVFRYRKINPEVQTSFSSVSHKRFYTAVVVLCVNSLLFAFLPIFGVGIYDFSTSHGVCFTDWSDHNRVFRTIFYIIVIGLAFPVLTICYSRLFFVLRKHRKNVLSTYKTTDAGADTVEKDENKNIAYFKSIVSTDQSGRKYGINIHMKKTSINKDTKEASGDEKTPRISEADEKEKNSETSNLSSSELADAVQDTKYDDNRIRQQKKNVAKKLSKQEYQVTKLMICIFIAYFVCWIPAAVVNVIALSTHAVPSLWLYIIVTMVELKSALNPLIYGLGNRKYRRAFRKILDKYCRFGHK